MELLNLLRKILEGKYIIIRKQVKRQNTSGIVYVPIKYKYKTAVIIIDDENKGADTLWRE